MTLVATEPVELYTIAGATTPLDFDHSFETNTDLKVYEDGVLQTLGVDYTVTGAGVPAGGVVTPIAATVGSEWVIFRDMPMDQDTALPNEQTETGLDRIMRRVQGLRVLIDRAILGNWGEDPPNLVDFTVQADRAEAAEDGALAAQAAAEAAVLGDIAAAIHIAPNKVTPVGADEFGIWNSVGSVLGRLSFTNLKAALFDLAINLTSSDAGAGAGPDVYLDRFSASPAVSDFLGRFVIRGKNSIGTTKEYASIDAQITDPVSGSEDAIIRLVPIVAGASAASVKIGAGLFMLGAADPGAGKIAAVAGDAAAPALIVGDVDSGIFGTGASTGVTANGVETLRISALQMMIGKTASDLTAAGIEAYKTGFVAFTRSAGAVMNIDRLTDDGTLISLLQANVLDGSITTSAGVVTYGTFFGSHWSQLAGGKKKINIPRGTIVDTIDEMCVWLGYEYTRHTGEHAQGEKDLPDGLVPGDKFMLSYEYGKEVGKTKKGKPIIETAVYETEATVVILRNDTLCRFEISKTKASRRPYGVFAWWDKEDGGNDAYIGALGTFVIRIDKDAVVKGGDLIESAGNGCGRVMYEYDETLNAISAIQRHVATVTSNTPIPIHPFGPLHYDDGSYIVPCTLHCG